MPPIDRVRLAPEPLLGETLAALCDGAREIDMPEPARLALEAVSAAGEDDRRWLIGNILSDAIPEDSAAAHLFAGAAVQVHLARLAATLDADALSPVGSGVCPACGGRPVTSSITGAMGIENLRYAACSCCAARWNEVRIKCLCCGSTKGVSYRSVETVDATVKAEICSECNHWVKILHEEKNPTLDPVADDVGSLGLVIHGVGLRARERVDEEEDDGGGKDDGAGLVQIHDGAFARMDEQALECRQAVGGQFHDKDFVVALEKS